MPLVLQSLSEAGGEDGGLVLCGDVRAETAIGQKDCRMPLGLDGCNAAQSSLDLCFLASTHNISPGELDPLVRPSLIASQMRGGKSTATFRGRKRALRRNVEGIRSGSSSGDH